MPTDVFTRLLPLFAVPIPELVGLVGCTLDFEVVCTEDL